jgi:hypothetical protein
MLPGLLALVRAEVELAAILIARESAISLFAGYRFGFGESFALTRDSLLASDYEALCKAALRKAQEWQKEGR